MFAWTSVIVILGHSGAPNMLQHTKTVVHFQLCGNSLEKTRIFDEFDGQVFTYLLTFGHTFGPCMLTMLNGIVCTFKNRP